MFRNKSFLLTVILPIVISILVAILIVVLNSKGILNTRAYTTVKNELNNMNSSIHSLNKDKEELTYQGAQYDKEINDNKILVDEVTALNDEVNIYNENIEGAKATITELDKTIEDKTAYNNSLNNIKKETNGQKYTYSNTKLNIPSDLPSGRYKAEGTGKLYIYTIAGTLEDSQNIALLDSQTYSFNVYSGQYLKIEGTLNLTLIS